MAPWLLGAAALEGQLVSDGVDGSRCPRGPQPLACRLPCSSPAKKPSLLKAHQFEGDPFDSGSEGSEGSEGLGPCVLSLGALMGTVAETSEDKYRLLDQRDRVMRQGMGCLGAVREGGPAAWSLSRSLGPVERTRALLLPGPCGRASHAVTCREGCDLVLLLEERSHALIHMLNEYRAVFSHGGNTR